MSADDKNPSYEGLDDDGEIDTSADQRPRVATGIDVHRVLDELDEALSSTDPLLYQRANELVLVVGSGGAEGRARFPVGTPVLRPLTAQALLPRVTEHVNFMRKTKPSKEEITAAKLDGGRRPRWGAVKCIPPPSILSSFLEKSHWDRIRTIRGITGCPFLRPDGSVAQCAGYDPLTGYLFIPNADYPLIPGTPTQADAAVALHELEQVFVDFPHVSESDRMVPIAAILTVIARPSILGSIPAFIFDASTSGSGKTLQCDVVSAVATGRAAERQSFPNEDVELEKTLCSYALAGVPIMLLDNVTRKFGGGPLDKVLTARGDVSFRKLGGNEIRSLPWVSIVMASGNGIEFFNDTARRVVVSRLESPLDQPETREVFVHDKLIMWVLEHRARFVVAALTILRAYVHAGYPAMGCSRWGSFEEWAELIPPAIVFAGGADPLRARPTELDSGMGRTQESEDLGNILEGVARCFGTKPATCHEILREAFIARAKDPSLDALRQSLRLVTKCRLSDDVDPAILGMYIRAKRGARVGGARFVRDDNETKHRGSARWYVL